MVHSCLSTFVDATAHHTVVGTRSGESYGNVKVTLTASTAAKIVVWREDDLFHAQRSDTLERSHVCLEVDLFEVIAELAGLDLEQGEQAAEAMRLAERAQERLRPNT